MSLTVLTINAEYGADTSPIRYFDITLTGDSSYPTGGSTTIEAVLRDLIAAERTRAGSLGSLTLLDVQNLHPQTTYQFILDKENDKLIMRGWDGAQPNNATDMHGVTYRLLTTWA